jgi:hypothetical protein
VADSLANRALRSMSAAHNSFFGTERLTDNKLDDIVTKCGVRAETEKVAETAKGADRKRSEPWSREP